MDGKDLKDIDVPSHIEDAVTVPANSGTLIVSTIPLHLGDLLPFGVCGWTMTDDN